MFLRQWQIFLSLKFQDFKKVNKDVGSWKKEFFLKMPAVQIKKKTWGMEYNSAPREGKRRKVVEVSICFLHWKSTWVTVSGAALSPWTGRNKQVLSGVQTITKDWPGAWIVLTFEGKVCSQRQGVAIHKLCLLIPPHVDQTAKKIQHGQATIS